MNYEFVAIPDDQVPLAADPLFQHLIKTYASETNKTASMWRAIPDDLLDYRPHEKANIIRAILVHQILSERRFFAQFVGTRHRLALDEPPGRCWRSASGRLELPGKAILVGDDMRARMGSSKFIE